MAENFEMPKTFDEGFHGEKESHPWIKKMPFRALGQTGIELSTLSYGGSSLAGFYGDVERQEAVETIQESIKSGINYLDTSPWYGDSESVIGEALVGIPRHTYYIGTKVGRNFTPSWEGRFDFSRSAVLKNVETSLERLRLPFLDIIQVHDVEFCQDIDILLTETIPALENVVKAGKAKFIGITGYDLNFLEEIVRRVRPGLLSTVLSYARFNFHDDSLLNSTEFFVRNNIGIINAAPLAMGLLTSQGPPKWHPASSETQKAARISAEVARTHGSSLERASLQYSLRPNNPAIATTLVSIPTKKILEENLSIVTSVPDDKDIRIQELIRAEMKSGKTGHWEGVEVAEYKTWLRSREF